MRKVGLLGGMSWESATREASRVCTLVPGPERTERDGSQQRR